MGVAVGWAGQVVSGGQGNGCGVAKAAWAMGPGGAKWAGRGRLGVGAVVGKLSGARGGCVG